MHLSMGRRHIWSPTQLLGDWKRFGHTLIFRPSLIHLIKMGAVIITTWGNGLGPFAASIAPIHDREPLGL